jgi:membrane protease YdiL (CAAX protease family)
VDDPADDLADDPADEAPGGPPTQPYRSVAANPDQPTRQYPPPHPPAGPPAYPTQPGSPPGPPGQASPPPGSQPPPPYAPPYPPYPSYAGQPYPPYPGPPYPPDPGPPYPPYPGQPQAGQSYPPYPGQAYPPYPGQAQSPYPGQAYPPPYPYVPQQAMQQWADSTGRPTDPRSGQGVGRPVPGYPGQPGPWGGPAGQPAYAPPQPLPSFPHPEPRRYEQMLRTWTYEWWRPLVGIVLVLVGTIVLAPVVLLPVLMLGIALEGGPFLQRLQDAATLQAVGPSTLLYLNLTLGAGILVCWFVMRYLHRMRPRWLTSVVPKMRWQFFWICVGISVLALIAQVLVSVMLPGNQEADFTGELNDFTGTTVAIAVVVLLTTPLQAAGEEYIFRGYLMQAIGSFFAFGPDRATQIMSRWCALLVTSLLFALAHGAQNFPLFFDRFMFGLIAGWLVLRTGGLEAGIAMHILNNFLAFGFALTYGDLNESLNVSEVSWWNVPLTLTQAGTYALLVVLVARRLGLKNRTQPPAPAEVGEAGRGGDPVALRG